MKPFDAYVRVNGLVVKTRVYAENSQAAYFLLIGQYGQTNIVHLPIAV